MESDIDKILNIIEIKLKYMEQAQDLKLDNIHKDVKYVVNGFDELKKKIETLEAKEHIHSRDKVLCDARFGEIYTLKEEIKKTNEEIRKLKEDNSVAMFFQKNPRLLYYVIIGYLLASGAIALVMKLF
jgi:peptidoglycan hydrolase CwlO-like protein